MKTRNILSVLPALSIIASAGIAPTGATAAPPPGCGPIAPWARQIDPSRTHRLQAPYHLRVGQKSRRHA